MGRCSETVAVVEDISERRAAEEEIRLAKETIEDALAAQKAVFDNSPHGIALFKEGRIVQCNAAFASSLNHSRLSILMT